MKVFLIVVAVIVVIFAIILSLSAELTLIYDKKWTTRVRVLFIEKDIELSKILSFLLFPEKTASDVSEERKNQQKDKNNDKEKDKEKSKKSDKPADKSDDDKKSDDSDKEKKQKPNYIKTLYETDGVLGILLMISNLLQTANSAIITFVKGFHIYSLYVKMIIGGNDAADIARFYGTVCGIYYPIKGMILNSMRVDQYDDYVQPDFIAPKSEYEFQFIASINIALLLKIVLRAGKVFVVNLIKNK
jgi:hypothetical protein